jgi:molybdate transport system substrate-binding protein
MLCDALHAAPGMKIYRHTISASRDGIPSIGGTLEHPCEIKVWGPRAIATVLWEVGSQFELLTGHQLDIDSALADSYVGRLNSGERFDVFVGVPALVDALIKDGKIAADSRTPLVRSRIGVEVRAGAPRPDIGSVEAFKRTLLDAKSIAYLNVGGGLHIAAMIERLGLANALRSKVTRPDTDIVSELVANGDVELGMVIATQILTTAGVQFVGPLPPALQSHVAFVGGVSGDTKVSRAARELLGFLRGPTAAAVIKSQGMELT